MARILSIVVSLIAVSFVYPRGTYACGNNQRLGKCGRICEATCANPDFSGCADTTVCSGNGCQCKEGYLRNEATDLCVPASMCPPRVCRDNEILAECGRNCEGTCHSPRRPEKCFTIKCANRSCRCDLESGYVRDTNTEQCIPVGDCHESTER